LLRNTPAVNESICCIAKESNQQQNDDTTNWTQGNRRQSELIVPKISNDKAKELDHEAAIALYMSAAPFGFYEQPHMEQFLKTLNPAYKFPNRRRFGNDLLHKSYEKVKKLVDCHLQQSTQLNIIMDESSNIAMQRIANMSVHTQNGAFYYASDDIKAQRSTAELTQV
jgi:hypothetical protein